METWMRRGVGTGLAKLLTLRLQGCPASDMIEMTLDTWIETLTFNRVWDEQRDAPRLRHAFKVLQTSCDSWPAPVNLLQHLPPVESRPALPAKPVSDDVAQANIRECMRLLYGKGDDETEA